MEQWSWGPGTWDELVDCVTRSYAPFDIEVTDRAPGDVDHFEVMVGGQPQDIGVTGAAGIAPGIPCDGIPDNTISFVFAAQTQDASALCWSVLQESVHGFGLDHELDESDPMSYLGNPTLKTGFQDAEVWCGESTPRACACGGQTQNSFHKLLAALGPGPGAPGAPCNTDGDCVSSLCASNAGSSVCTVMCDAPGGCPEGFACNYDTYFCLPQVPGGCSTDRELPSLVVAIVVLATGRRRNRSR